MDDREHFEPPIVYDPPRLTRRPLGHGNVVLFWSGLLCMVAGFWLLGTWESTWWVNTYIPGVMVIVAGVLLLVDVLVRRK